MKDSAVVEELIFDLVCSWNIMIIMSIMIE